MSIPSYIKDPSATLDYEFDWSSWLESGDTIQSVVCTAPTGLTKESESSTGTTVTVWLSGGSAGRTYYPTCQITTTSGRTDERSIEISVQSR